MASQSTRVSSPEATGGPGNVFEQHVDAVFLAILLVGGVPPVFTKCRVRELHFQTEHHGWRTDDLLAVTVDGAGNDHKLIAQVKRTFTVSSSDDECNKTISAFWDDFNNTTCFDPRRDALVLITLRGTNVLLRRFVPLLDCARASISAEDFAQRLNADGYLHNESKRQAASIRTILAVKDGKDVSDERFWSFLRVIHVLSFDLATSTRQTEAWIRMLLSHTTSEPDTDSVASTTWSALLDLAATAKSTAASLRRDQLPETMLQRHAVVASAATASLKTLSEHSDTIMRRLSRTIGGTLSLPRTNQVAQVLEALEECRVVLITGPAGFGKSVVAQSVWQALAQEHPAFALRAEELETSHLDVTLHNAQLGVSAERLFALLAAQGRKYLLVDSLERLLEASTREGLADLLEFVKKDESWRLILTCRSYSVDIVRSALLAQAGLPHVEIKIPGLLDDELAAALKELPQLRRPIENPRLRELLRSPYLLDNAALMDWPEGQAPPEDERGFRRKFWRDVVREDIDAAGGLPRRRDQTLVEIAVRRAQALSVFVPCDDLDQEALGRLRACDLVLSPSDYAAAPVHDVLEDWAIIEWLESAWVTHSGDPAAMAAKVEGYPAIRRAFRMWMNEKLSEEPERAAQFVFDTVRKHALPQHFRDDTMVAMLLSADAPGFLQRHRAVFIENECDLLIRTVHLLRVACKAPAPWIRGGHGWQSAFLVPTGDAWPTILGLVLNATEDLLPDHVGLVVGLVEEWASQVNWRTPSPAGFEDAGLLLFKCLPHLDGYNRKELRKRLLKVITKVPLSNRKACRDLIRRATIGDREDQVANEFAEVLLNGMDGGFVCRDMPTDIVDLARAHFRLNDDDVSMEHHASVGIDIEPMFGITSSVHFDYFPASSIRDPWKALLQYHPTTGVEAIVGLLNHSAAWYAEQRWPGFCLEPVFDAQINVDGEEVTQWANGRWWAAYRGHSVVPYVLQSALMALEAWLLSLAKAESEHLEAWLLKCIRDSSNVATTALVASVCVASPAMAGKAGLAVLSNRDFFFMDRSRMVSEMTGSLSGLFPATNIQNELFDNERKQSDALGHRRRDLEALAVQLQFGAEREAVWAILDAHKAALPEQSEQSEDDKLWRLSLHRMDIRGFRQLSVEEVAELGTQPPAASEEDKENAESGNIYFGPGELESDLQALVSESQPQFEKQNADLALSNWGIGAWKRDVKTDLSSWREMLRKIRKRTTNAKGEGDIDELARHAPGFIASVCTRDYWEEMNAEEQEWCIETVKAAVLEYADDYEQYATMQRSELDASRPCAYVCAALVSRLGIDAFGGQLQGVFVTALTHPIDEVVAYAAEGVAEYIGEDGTESILRIAVAMAGGAARMAELMQAENEKPYEERRQYLELKHDLTPELRRAMCSDGPFDTGRLCGLELDTWSGRVAARTILGMTANCRGDSSVREFMARCLQSMASRWVEDRRGVGRRDFEFDHELMRRAARYVLLLPEEEACRLCEPIADSIDLEDREVSTFVHELLIAADRTAANQRTAFWSIWQMFADRLADSRLARGLAGRWDSYVPEILYRVFLSSGWKNDVRHWTRLEGEAHRIDELLMRLPPCAPVLEAYLGFLGTAGGQSLPDALVLIEQRVQEGNPALSLRSTNAVFDLESILRRLVYGQPRIVKEREDIRTAVLSILDCLVDAGSSGAYRMRDDFVTPLGSSA